MTKAWTPGRRARQAEIIHSWRPWDKSTGPKTDTGKFISARNADKGGVRPKLRAVLKSWREVMEADSA